MCVVIVRLVSSLGGTSYGCKCLFTCMQLEGVLHKLDMVHEDFRLWITTEPHPAFPIGLLQMSIKVTNEAPVGLKAGLRATFQWITQVSFLTS